MVKCWKTRVLKNYIHSEEMEIVFKRLFDFVFSFTEFIFHFFPYFGFWRKKIASTSTHLNLVIEFQKWCRWLSNKFMAFNHGTELESFRKRKEKWKENKKKNKKCKHHICVQQPIDFPVYAAECMLTLGRKVSTVGSS